MQRQFCRRLLFVVVLLSASARSSVAQAPDVQLKPLLQERYASLKAAMASRDPKAIGALLAPDFQSADADGHVQNADQLIQQVGASSQDPNRVSDTTIVSVEQRGSTATVTQRYHMTTTRAGSDGRPPQAIEMVTTSTDTWLLSQGAWLLQRTQTEELELKIDGKVVAHKQRAPSS